MTTLQTVIALGVAGGLGLALVVAGLSRSRVDLGQLLTQMSTSSAEATPGATAGGGFTAWLDSFNRVPAVELELIGETRQRFLLIRIGFALVGAVFLPVLALILIIAGMPLPVVIPAGLSVVGAAVGWLLPPQMVRSQAADARRAFRRALCAYFDMVALERQADRGPVEALEHPTTIAEGSWALARLRVEMDRARRLGQPPWQALRVLADRVGIDELDDLGSILTLSQEEGAAIVESLSAKATSMRQRLLAEDLAVAHEQNRMLDLPLSLIGMTIVLALVFPGLYLLTTT